jgi:ADP-ribose pyrophosphatase YjhB (NUDIX family)
MAQEDRSLDAPVMAASAIVRRGGRYLLVRRGNPPARDLYAFPGGRVEDGETLAEAALRELKEETGLDGRNPRAHSSHQLVTEDENGRVTHRFVLTAHLVEADDDQAPVAGDDALEARWFTAAEARRLNMPESVRACIDSLEHDAAEGISSGMRA